MCGRWFATARQRLSEAKASRKTSSTAGAKSACSSATPPSREKLLQVFDQDWAESAGKEMRKEEEKEAKKNGKDDKKNDAVA